MQPSNLLPISNPNSPPSMLIPTSSATADTMLVRSEPHIIPSSSSSTILLVQDDDDSKIETKPLLTRAFSYSSSSSSSSNLVMQQRRRRIASANSLLSGAVEGCRREMGRAASDTYVVTRLSFRLLRYLGVGYRWIARFLALGCYAMLLIPGFIQVGYYYFYSSQVLRGIVYGDQPRNRLDLYLPKNMNGPKPVVAFVTGGAWIIGYKAWGSLLGQQLSERDIIVACIDYRNFPQGTISDMVKDASQGISFVCNKIAEYGGDPNRIYLMGQSAGAHIATCALLEQAIKETGAEPRASWSVSQIKTYFGLSGGYNILKLVDHFHSRGLYRSIFLSIMEGEQGLKQYSPELMAQDPNTKNAVSLLPPMVLFHGTADYSIPCDSSKSFADTLKALGVKAECILYEGKTHTDLFLQDPMRSGIDDMLDDLITLIHGDSSETIRANSTPRK
ncbi:probable isoprenylcysteine alpha-carbonyl methylesterase ICMEL1 isoform X6 [Solanum verrucosum]|uniref:probable isoprenylcysteine alpha-carbonyl methylesterase ICMEL1 isoform X5 n=1 Tax=Solanum verrucosum TaxID=315347 RepID=UPI0020D1DC1A|nr:probable isoprenylcysteine alpha-carbonyl methylesterase ICMEL1 isoform X5 [Solanum verrucosum]XP_049365023.1 probable isoprenylcysteine alpha-carbonyl methylesterase ICMEL1 isoform X6 [Solanum verrucosum]